LADLHEIAKELTLAAMNSKGIHYSAQATAEENNLQYASEVGKFYNIVLAAIREAEDKHNENLRQNSNRVANSNYSL